MSFSNGAAALCEPGPRASEQPLPANDDAVHPTDAPQSQGAALRSAELEDIIVGQGPTDSLRLLTCGSVDDGKSTLIGRLLWDAADLHEDQRAKLISDAADGTPEFARLLDGLSAEREQGITIDIAWRYFDAGRRRYVIIDSPGHEQYTRNMASGASHADVAILLVDARHGIKPQTRRHAAILDLMGVSEVIVAVNKMDLVGFSQARFSAIEADFKALASGLGFKAWNAIPLAALSGDNVTERSDVMSWYTGPTLLERLEATPARVLDTAGPLRFPVQSVFFDRKDFRGLAGTIASGRVAPGDEIVDPISGQVAAVRRIVTMDGALPEARKGQAIVLELDRDLDIARGAVLARNGEAPAAVQDVTARLVWLSEDAFDPGARYLVRTATDLAPVETFRVDGKVELETLSLTQGATSCGVNDIVVAALRFSRPMMVERFSDTSSRGLGAFMLVDALTGASVACGIVSDVTPATLMDRTLAPGQSCDDHGAAPEVCTAQMRSDQPSEAISPRHDGDVFVVDRDVLQQGLCADLGASAAERAEFERRALEVGRILDMAGISHRIEIV